MQIPPIASTDRTCITPIFPTHPNPHTGYGLHWLRLQQGYSHELAFRSILTKVAVRLSGIARLNHYIPNLDVNQTDMIITLQTAAWTLPIHVSVKSSIKPNLALGLTGSGSTLMGWLEKNEKHRLPCIIAFAYRGRFSFFTPSDVKKLSSKRRSIAVLGGDISDEDQLFHLLKDVAAVATKASAEHIFL